MDGSVQVKGGSAVNLVDIGSSSGNYGRVYIGRVGSTVASYNLVNSATSGLVLEKYDGSAAAAFEVRMGFSVTAGAINLGSGASTIGFYGASPTALQTGVAVSAAGIHAALVNLGLITA